jgi:hypothetical protein
MFFVINERQHRWWLYGDDRDSLYRSIDAEPLPTEPQRERSTFARRLVLRLRVLMLGSRPRSGQGSTGA